MISFFVVLKTELTREVAKNLSFDGNKEISF